jgi:hypothetical protein
MVDNLGEDIQKAWTDFPKDNQKTVRDTRINDLNVIFNRDVAKADVPPNTNVQKAMEQAISNIAKAKTYLKMETMQQDRVTYANACLAAMRREVQQASDFKTARTTQQCFEMMLDMFTLMREKLHSCSNDIQQQAMAGVNTVIGDLVRNSTVPDKPDPTVQMDLNIKEARRKFPTTTDDLEKANRPVLQLLESMAKTIQQYATSKR